MESLTLEEAQKLQPGGLITAIESVPREAITQGNVYCVRDVVFLPSAANPRAVLFEYFNDRLFQETAKSPLSISIYTHFRRADEGAKLSSLSPRRDSASQ